MTSIMPLMPWVNIVVIFWESLLIAIYRAVLKVSPEWSMGVILGSKLLKMLIVIVAILSVRYLTEIPVRPFAFLLLGYYVVTIIFETIIFLYFKKKQNEQKQ